MRNFAILLLTIMAAATFAVSDYADAARLGGGRSFGAQRQGLMPGRPAAPNSGAASQPVMPAQPNAAAAKAATPQPSGMSRWLGPIAGLAAGLGLGALLSHFGLSEGFGSFLLFVLLAVAIVVVVRMVLAQRNRGSTNTSIGPMQYAGVRPGAGAGGYASEPFPAWGGAPKPDALPGGGNNGSKPLPPGFDVDTFVSQAKLQFNRLQAAYDAADRNTLADVMTPEMFDEVNRDLSKRNEHHATEVVSLNAEVLDVSTEDDKHWASVRYTGLLREDGEQIPKPIDEIWNLTKPVSGRSGWLLAGVQQAA